MPDRPEHKVATHAGTIWPLPRAEMIDGTAIALRLAEDAASIVEDCRARREARLGVDRFVALGWTEAQVIAHAAVALEATRAAIHRPPQGDTTRLPPIAEAAR